MSDIKPKFRATCRAGRFTFSDPAAVGKYLMRLILIGILLILAGFLLALAGFFLALFPF